MSKTSQPSLIPQDILYPVRYSNDLLQEQRAKSIHEYRNCDALEDGQRLGHTIVDPKVNDDATLNVHILNTFFHLYNS